MEEWEKRLIHERAVRDCHVKAGNIPPPSKPDPEGGIWTYHIRRFNGVAYWKAMNETGHDYAEFQRCICSHQKEGER